MASYRLGISCIRILSNCRQLLLSVFKSPLIHFIFSPGYSLVFRVSLPLLPYQVAQCFSNISQLMFPLFASHSYLINSLPSHFLLSLAPILNVLPHMYLFP